MEGEKKKRSRLVAASDARGAATGAADVVAVAALHEVVVAVRVGRANLWRSGFVCEVKVVVLLDGGKRRRRNTLARKEIWVLMREICSLLVLLVPQLVLLLLLLVVLLLLLALLGREGGGARAEDGDVGALVRHGGADEDLLDLSFVVGDGNFEVALQVGHLLHRLVEVTGGGLDFGLGSLDRFGVASGGCGGGAADVSELARCQLELLEGFVGVQVEIVRLVHFLVELGDGGLAHGGE